MDLFGRTVSNATCLLFALLVWAACGVAAPEPTPAQVETPSQSAGSEPIVLRVVTGDSGMGLIPHERIIDKFEAENPDIIIELESIHGGDYYGRLLTAIRADEAPDIIQIGDDALPRFVGRDALLPLDRLMDGRYPLDRQIYLPGLLEPGQWAGQQYLLPKDYSTLAVYYNKKIFDEHGMSYPNTGWTWDEFLATAQALTQDTDGDGQTDLWGVQLPGSWTTGFEYWVAAAGGQLISPDGQSFEGYFDSPETVNAFQLYADLYNRYEVAPLPVDLTAFGGGNTEFENGRAAMMLFGRWPQTSLLENPNVELGVVSPPQAERQANILIWSGFGIQRDTPHQEAAWRFLRFYTGQQGAEIWKDWALPAVGSVAEAAGLTDDPIDGVWLDELDHLVPRGYTYSPHWESTAEPALRRVLEQIIIDPQADVPAIVSAAAQMAQSQFNAVR